MAGKDYKVQKKAKEQQRLSVFQPAFRWGGNNANSTGSNGSSSKIEARKNDRLDVHRNDRLEIRKNERVDQPRRPDNRLAIKEDPEVKMARDAKRMTTFQPIFGSLFSSKPSKGKSPEPTQPPQARRPPVDGSSIQHSSGDQASNSARYGAANAGSGSSKGGRAGPGYQNNGLRIDTGNDRGSNSRRNEATNNSSGRNARGGLAPVPEGYSPRPRSPLQRNPAFSLPEDETRPLGISNAYGPGGRGKEKANVVSNVPANSRIYSSGGDMRDPKSNGQDRNTSLAPTLGRGSGRDESPLRNQKIIGVDAEYNPTVQRGRPGIGSQRNDLGAEAQLRAGKNSQTKPVVPNVDTRIDPRQQKQPGRGTREDKNPEQHLVGLSQNVPQLIVTDTNDVSSSGASGRPIRSSNGQQSVGATASKTMPGQRPDPTRKDDETSRVNYPGGLPPFAPDGTGLPRSRSPLSRNPATSLPKVTQETRDVSPGASQEDPRRIALSKPILPQEPALKPSLSVFPRQQPQPRQPAIGAESETMKSKSSNPLQPNSGREEVDNPSRVRNTDHYETKVTTNYTKPKERQIRDVTDARIAHSSPVTLPSEVAASRHMPQKAPLEGLKPFAASNTPQMVSSKSTANASRGPLDVLKPYISAGQHDVPNGTIRKPVQRNEMSPASGGSSRDGKFERPRPSLAEETTTSLKAGTPSKTVQIGQRPEQGVADQSSEAQAQRPEDPRTGWASRYFEASRREKADSQPLRVERLPNIGRKAVSTADADDAQAHQDSQASEARQRNGADGGAPSFKQRIQESLGGGKESNLLKPLRSKFSGAEKQEVDSQNLNKQTSQPLAGGGPWPQVEATTKRTQQPDSPANFASSSKSRSPPSNANDFVTPGSTAKIAKSKKPLVADWLPSNTAGTPANPDRLQDELFMGTSGSTLKPNPPPDNIELPRPSQPSEPSDRRPKQTPSREIDEAPSKAKTNGPAFVSTRKPAEAKQLSEPEQDLRSYIPVVENTSVSINNSASSTPRTETPTVRVVSRTIERPKEIEIQKPLRSGKNMPPPAFEDLSSSNLLGQFEIAQSRTLGRSETEHLDSPSRQVAEPRQVNETKALPETRRGNGGRDQSRRSERNEAQKPSSIDDEWPRPVLTPTRIVQTDATGHTRARDGEKSFSSEGRMDDVPEDSASRETSQKSGLLGRWVGRAKRDKTPDQANQSIGKQPPVTKSFEAAPGLGPEFDAQRPTPREEPEVGIPASVQVDQRTRDNPNIPSISIIEPPAERSADTGATQRSTSTSPASDMAQSVTTSPPPFSSQSGVKRPVFDAPAPLSLGGRKPAHLIEAEPKSQEGLGRGHPLTAEKQPSSVDTLRDLGMPDTDRVEKSKLTSPPLPSQEDFFKQMRQSVMFQNLGSAEKADFTEPTDATTKRKSRRNRNVSISGMQPMRGIDVPEVPALSNSDYRSAAGGAAEGSYPDVAQDVEDVGPKQGRFDGPQTQNVSDARGANKLEADATRTPLREEQRFGTRSAAPVKDGKPEIDEDSGSPPMRLNHIKLSPDNEESSLPTWLGKSSPLQALSSGSQAGVRLARTDEAEMEQPRTAPMGPSTSRSTEATKMRQEMTNPVMLTDQTRDPVVEQANFRSPDMGDKSKVPPVIDSKSGEFDQSLASPESVSTASRGPDSDMHIKEVKKTRVPLHPVPSHTKIFRQPSFDGPDEPTTTHNVSPSRTQADPKVHSFFDELFKSKDTDEFALEMEDSTSSKDAATREGRGIDVSHATPAEAPSTPAQPAAEVTDSQNLKGVSSPPSRQPHNVHEQHSEPPLVGTTSAFDMRESLSQIGGRKETEEPMRRMSNHAQPIVSSATDDLTTSQFSPAIPSASIKFNTSKESTASAEAARSHNTHLEPSPSSTDVPLLFVEDASAARLSGEEIIVNHAQSPEQPSPFRGKLNSSVPEPILSKIPGERSTDRIFMKEIPQGNSVAHYDPGSNDTSQPGHQMGPADLLKAERSDEADQYLAKSEIDEHIAAPETSHDSFISYHGKEKLVPVIASTLEQGDRHSPDTDVSHAAYEPNPREFVKESMISTREPGLTTEESYVQTTPAHIMHVNRNSELFRAVPSVAHSDYEEDRDATASSRSLPEPHQVGHQDSSVSRPVTNNSPSVFSPPLGEKSPAVVDDTVATNGIGHHHPSVTAEHDDPFPLAGMDDQKTTHSGESSPHVSFLHDEKHGRLSSPSEVDGYPKQAATAINFTSQSNSPGIPTSRGHGSPLAQYADTQHNLAESYMPREDSGPLQSNKQRDNITSSLGPLDGVESTVSPQESDADLSDHILSLYDGSEYIAPDHKSTGQFPDYRPSSFDGHRSTMNNSDARSSRELRTPTEDHRLSTSSFEPTSAEVFKEPSSPSNAHDMHKSAHHTESPLILDPTTQSRPPTFATSASPREIPDSVNAESESMEPAPLKPGGIKERIRKLFGNDDSAEPSAGSESQPAVASPVPVLAHSPEPSVETPDPHGEHDDTDESRVLSPALPRSNGSPVASPTCPMFDGTEAGLSDLITSKEANISPDLMTSPLENVSEKVHMGRPCSLDLSAAKPTPDDASPVLESQTGETKLPPDWSPLQGASVVSPPPSYEASCQASLQPLNGVYPEKEVLSPEPSDDCASTIDVPDLVKTTESQHQSSSPELSSFAEHRQFPAHQSHFSEENLSPPADSSSMVSPGQPVSSLERTPARLSIAQYDDTPQPTVVHSPDEELPSYDLNHPSETGSLLDTYNDGAQFAPIPGIDVPETNELGTNSSPTMMEGHPMGVTSRPNSFVPEANYNTAPDMTPDVDAYETSPVEFMGELFNPDDHLGMSSNSAHDTENDHPKDHINSQGDETPGSDIHESTFANSVLDEDSRGTWASPTSPTDDNLVNGDIELTRDAYEDSPQTGNMDERSWRESMPNSPRVVEEMSSPPRSSADRPMNDDFMQPTSFSPTEPKFYRDDDDVVTMLGGAEPDFDAHPGYPDDRDVSDGQFAAEPAYNSGDDFRHPADDDFRVDDYQNSPQGLEYAGGNHSANGDYENRESGYEDFGGDRFPTDDSPGNSGDFNDTRVESYPADDHQSAASGFDGFGGNNFPAEDFGGESGDFDGPGMSSYPDDSFPSHDGGFEPQRHSPDGFQDGPGGFGDDPMDDYPADDFPSNGDRFEESGVGVYPADDFQSHSGGFDDAGRDTYPADDFQTHPGAFDDAGMDSYPADDFQSPPAGYDNTGMDSYPADDFQSPPGGFDDAGMDDYPADDFQNPSGGFDNVGIDSYPTDNFQSPPGGFDNAEMDNYPADDFQSHPGGFDDTGIDSYPADDTAFDNYGAEDFDDHDGQPFDPMCEEQFPPYEQDNDPAYPADDVDDFNPIIDDMPYEEPALSDYGGEKDMDLGDGLYGDNQEDGPFGDEHFDDEGFPGDDNQFDDRGGFDGEGEWDNQAEDADLGREPEGDFDDFGDEPAWEADGVQPVDFDERAMSGEGEPFGTDFYEGQPEGERGLDEFEEYPMNAGEDFPMGGEAEEYYLGGDGGDAPDAMEGGDEYPGGGEAEDYLMRGEEEYPMDEGEGFPMGEDDLPIDEMYGGVERSMDPMEGEEGFPMDEDELPIDEMYGGEERSMDPMEDEEGFPLGDDEALPTMEGEEYGMNGEDEFPMEGEAIEESDRDIDDLDADDQYEDDPSGLDAALDEEYGSHSDDGSLGARSVVDEDLGSDLADEDNESRYGDPSDEEAPGDPDIEEEDLGPSEFDDREIDDGPALSMGEEDEEDAEGERNMDDLYGQDVPSIPASPTSTDYGRELASPSPIHDHDEDGHDEEGHDEDPIFGEPATQQEPADLENADPVRLSCLYMQDVGLLSYPPTPTIPQEVDVPEQGEDEEEEEPREPVRFSTLYRQSLDWSQALSPTTWEHADNTLPEASEEQVSFAPASPPVPESAREDSHEDFRMLEVDHEQATPVAASPLSPRPLETPPPDSDHDDNNHGDAVENHLFDRPEELYKGVDENVDQRNPLSPRMQPTPPPDQDRAPSSSGSQDDQRDSRGPRTFDEMNLPRRVISPPNIEDDQDFQVQGSSSTQIPANGSRRSISQRFSGWWSGGGSSGQVRARPPPLPTPYDSRYGEPSSPT